MRIGLMLAAVLALAGCAAGEDSTDALQLVRSAPLPGVEGRFDHMAYDVARHRLFVAALGNNTLEVIDTQAGERVKEIEGLRYPTGIVVADDLGRIVVASGGDGKCRIYDDTLRLLGAVDSLDDADNIRYDAAARRVYVGYGDGALGVIDPETMTRVASIALDGHPESFQMEADGKRIFVNVPTANEVAVVDREKASVIATWPVKEARANFPMALDEAHHRLFIGCRRPSRLLVLDTANGSLVASLACCGDTDDIFYDAARSRIYLAGGEGCIDVFAQDDADHYRKLGSVSTRAGARTMLYAARIDRIFLAVPHRGSQPAEIREYSLP